MITVTSGIQLAPGRHDVVVTSVHGLTGKFTKIGNRVSYWCTDNGIDADLVTKWSSQDANFRTLDYSLWRIADDEDRLIFKLAWENRIIDEN
jgi:hypothetical protein